MRRTNAIVPLLTTTTIALLLVATYSPMCQATATETTTTTTRIPSRTNTCEGHLKHRRTTATMRLPRGGGINGIAEGSPPSSPKRLESGRHERSQSVDHQAGGDLRAFLSKVRHVVFPIHGREEVAKFLLIGSIKFYIILALTLTRDLKDTLVVTQCGAEAIAFLKIYGVPPAATAFIALYSKMASVLDKRVLFYTTCVPFFAFFILFNAIIYPNADPPTLAGMGPAIFGRRDDGRNCSDGQDNRQLVIGIVLHRRRDLFLGIGRNSVLAIR